MLFCTKSVTDFTYESNFKRYKNILISVIGEAKKNIIIQNKRNIQATQEELGKP